MITKIITSAFRALRRLALDYLYDFSKAFLAKSILWVLGKLFGFGLAIVVGLYHRERMSHNNGIAALGHAKIVSDQDFPPHPFFKPGGIFPLRIRHATAANYDDAMNGIRSISLKFADSQYESPFDLQLNTGRISLFWSALSFMKFGSMRKAAWGVEYENYYRQYPEGLKGAQVSLRRNPTSFVNLRYYSKTPTMFVGSDQIKRYAKYRVKPLDDEAETGITKNPSDWDTPNQRILPHETRDRNYLKDEYKKEVAKKGAKYMLQIQVRTASDDEDPEIFNNMAPWGDDAHPWMDLAILDIKSTLNWDESNLTSFSINHMPESLGAIPAKSILDYNSLNYLRAHAGLARIARLLSYKIFGMPKEIPDDDNRNQFYLN